MIADYLIVRKSKLRLSHLYMPNPNSIYYFTSGINFRTVTSWIFGVWPLMRTSPPLPITLDLLSGPPSICQLWDSVDVCWLPRTDAPALSIPLPLPLCLFLLLPL